ncbi:MAG TPA: zinc peptidase [Lactovum miscens]|uniref:zinc peptidase n=1 Tax=Lactovum miscens TaxID=190387 RepID=UPI002EDBA473
MQYTRPPQRSLRSHADRQKLLDEAISKNILEVAGKLGMDVVHKSGTYYWSEHDSLKFNVEKNYFFWNSRRIGGGPIQLVELIKECERKEALKFLTGIDVSRYTGRSQTERKDFHYFLTDHKTFDLARNYLKQERGLSDETIDFFHSQGLITQSSFKDTATGKTEPVVVFKAFDNKGKLQGITVQGIWRNEAYGKREHLKRTLGNGFYGMTVRVGNPPKPSEMSPERPLVIAGAESPIDLMSYYELFKENIGDAVLTSMNGLRKGNISTLLANELQTKSPENMKDKVLDTIEESIQPTQSIKIILAVDNDEIKTDAKTGVITQAGKDFVNDFNITKIPVVPHIPKLLDGQIKADWNETLKVVKSAKKAPKNAFEKRLDKLPSSSLKASQNVNQTLKNQSNIKLG